MKYIKSIDELFNIGSQVKSLIKRKFSKLSHEVLREVHYDFDGIQQLSIVSDLTNKYKSKNDRGVSAVLDKQYALKSFKKFGILYFGSVQGAVHDHMQSLKKYSDDDLVYKLESIIQIAEDHDCEVSYFFILNNELTLDIKTKRYQVCMLINTNPDWLREIINYVDQTC